MNTHKQYLALIMITLLSLSLLSGCGTKSGNSSLAGSGSNPLDFSNTTLSGIVTAVDDNVITLSLSGGMGGRQMTDDGMGKGNRPYDASGANNDGQTPPELPADENDNQAATDNTSDNSSDSTKSQKQFYNRSNTTFTLTITDESVLEDCSLSDITENTMLTITFGDNNTITSISVTDTSNTMPNGDTPGSTTNGDSAVNTGTGATTITEDTEKTDVSYISETEDENALRVEGSVVYTGNSISIKKSGTSSNTESSDFYGLNAGLLALDGASVNITDSVITTNGQGANGIFAYGNDSNITVSNTSITTSADNSGGIDVTGGASIQAANLSIETSGNSSAAIRSDRGGGTLNVTGGTYTTNGTGSPAVYCTADITVSDAVLNATASEGVVIEGKNSVTLENCEVTGNMQGTYQEDESENLHGLMIYQSMSGDAAEGEASFTMNGGSLTTENGDLIYSTNTSSVITLSDVSLALANDTLLRVSGNDGSKGWGESGSNGADMNFYAKNQTLTGKVIVDEISSLSLSLSENSSYEGSINEAQEGGNVIVSLDDSCTWTLTGDSYISSFEGSLENVDFNGYTLYINGEAQEK
ncbi:MAG: right-handed parallel beta-helix repeat-containing protein [Lachnospiraceae bacterium]